MIMEMVEGEPPYMDKPALRYGNFIEISISNNRKELFS